LTAIFASIYVICVTQRGCLTSKYYLPLPTNMYQCALSGVSFCHGGSLRAEWSTV